MKLALFQSVTRCHGSAVLSRYSFQLANLIYREAIPAGMTRGSTPTLTTMRHATGSWSP